MLRELWIQDTISEESDLLEDKKDEITQHISTTETHYNSPTKEAT